MYAAHTLQILQEGRLKDNVVRMSCVYSLSVRRISWTLHRCPGGCYLRVLLFCQRLGAYTQLQLRMLHSIRYTRCERLRYDPQDDIKICKIQ